MADQFEAYFKRAYLDNDGRISGAEAVSFFQGSSLSKQVLAQIYFCLRSGYYDEASSVARSSRVSLQFAPQLSEWIATGGMVSANTAAVASEECEKMFRLGDRGTRAMYDRKKLLLYAMVSGSRRQIDCLLRECQTFSIP